MRDTVRKFMPDDIWNLGRNESWFSDLAEEGLHLRRIGLAFAVFERGEPKKMKYRIDVISPAPTEEQLEIYNESGWQFVTNIKELHIFSSPEESNYPELHTDPVEQSYTLTVLNKRLRSQVILISVCMALFFGMMFSMFFFEQTPTLAMMEAGGIQRPLLIFVEGYVFYIVIRNFIALRNLRKSLFEGNPINHREDWRKPRLVNGLIGAFFILVSFLTICIPAAEIAVSKTYTLPETPVDLPVIRLAEIEQNAALEREDGFFLRDVDWRNRVSYDWSPLSPVKYEISEHGVVQNEMWDDNSGSYSPSVETHYFKLLIPSMADSLIQDLMEWYVDDYEPDLTIRERDHAFFEKLVIAQSGIRKEIFACSGNEVIYVQYFGKAKAEDIVKLLPQALGN